MHILWFLLFIICVLVLYDFYGQLKTKMQLGRIPSISKIPLIGTFLQTLKLQPDILHLKFDEYTKCFGHTFYAMIFGQLIIITSHQRYVNEVLSSSTNVDKNRLYMMLQQWLGNGLLIANSKEWNIMRKIIMPSFSYNVLEMFVGVFDQHSRILVKHLRKYADGHQVVNIYPHIALCTLDIITETAMNFKTNAQDHSNSEFVNAMQNVTAIIATRFMKPYLCSSMLFKLFAPELFITHANGIKLMHNFTNEILQQRRESESQKTKTEADSGIKTAFLDILLKANIDGKPLTDQQIIDEVNTFVFAGHDTTTSAASFCLYLLSRHDNIQRKLYEEIETIFGFDKERSITYADINSMSYLNCVVKESLRLYPPIPAIGRILKEDIIFGDVTFPAKSNIIILLWSMLRNQDIFPEPEKFIPERENLSYLPFSGGRRNCIGQRFALFEVKTIVLQMLRHYVLLPLGDDIELIVKIVLTSKNGVQFGIKPRI